MIQKLKAVRRLILGRLRYLSLRLRFLDIRVGKNFFCLRHFYLARGFRARIGDNVYLGRYTHIGANLDIGNNVLVASHVAFVGGDHKIDNIGATPMKFSGRLHDKKTIVKDNVWIGHGAIIMAGITIQSGAVVAAGSVVTKDVGNNEIVGGSPARFIRKRIL